MADRICWNCGAVEDWEFQGAFTYRCKQCSSLERDIRCRKCLRPLFLDAKQTEVKCPHCGTKNGVKPGELEGQRVGFV